MPGLKKTVARCDNADAGGKEQKMMKTLEKHGCNDDGGSLIGAVCAVPPVSRKASMWKKKTTPVKTLRDHRNMRIETV